MDLSKVRPTINPLYKAVLGLGVALFISACTTQSPNAEEPRCTREGYFKSTVIVGGYYRCVWNPRTQKYTRYDYHCPSGQEFDEGIGKCQ
ncbi:hypothetical protein SAMN04490207_0779 [Pseudomonas gessardii]|nr:hypothetical protein SAMN04490207_0779 [Pseudomonas gessardii]